MIGQTKCCKNKKKFKCFLNLKKNKHMSKSKLNSLEQSKVKLTLLQYLIFKKNLEFLNILKNTI